MFCSEHKEQVESEVYTVQKGLRGLCLLLSFQSLAEPVCQMKVMSQGNMDLSFLKSVNVSIVNVCFQYFLKVKPSLLHTRANTYPKTNVVMRSVEAFSLTCLSLSPLFSPSR